MAGSTDNLEINKRFKDMQLDNNFILVEMARKGIKTALFYDFADTAQLNESDLATLINISARTVKNYQQLKKKLDPPYGEHLLKLINLYKKGELIFGNKTEFTYWLNKPFWNNREKPMDWLNTPGGVDIISDEIDRLANSYAV